MIANIIKKKLDCDVLELEPKYEFSSDYDEIIIGSPVWWYSITPVVREFLKENNLEVKEISITTVNEINQNLSANIKDIDALYVPTDNTVASAYELVGNICLNNNIPMLCAEEAGVSKGGLCSIGIDYYQLGKETAYKAVEIIEGKEPSEIKIEKSSDMNITINSDAAKKINIEIPKEIEEKAQIITGGVN